jgi:hypothetical protein
MIDWQTGEKPMTHCKDGLVASALSGEERVSEARRRFLRIGAWAAPAIAVTTLVSGRAAAATGDPPPGCPPNCPPPD